MQPLWLFFALCFISSSSLAVLVNVTIDDTLGDSETRTNITYIGEWNVGPSCPHCTSTNQLDREMIHNGTWHDSSANKKPFDITQQLPLAFVPFNGTAVYVYCIIADTKDKPNGNTDMTFLIDGQPAGAYTRQPKGDDTFDYNVLVFSTGSLSPERHTLTIQNGHIGGERSLVLLDYIVYSYDNGLTLADTATRHSSPTTPPTSQSSPAVDRSAVSSSGKIVGCVLGSIAFLLLVLVAVLWKRQQKTKASHLPKSQSFTSKWIPAIGRWRPASVSTSPFSFNPSLFVEPVANNRNRTIVSHMHPPPITTVLPIQPRPQRPGSTRPLEPNRETTPSPPPSGLDPRNEQRQPLSILEWQRRTQREANDTPPRFDVSDHFSSECIEEAQSPPRPRPAPRRFTVVNN